MSAVRALRIPAGLACWVLGGLLGSMIPHWPPTLVERWLLGAFAACLLLVLVSWAVARRQPRG